MSEQLVAELYCKFEHATVVDDMLRKLVSSDLAFAGCDTGGLYWSDIGQGLEQRQAASLEEAIEVVRDAHRWVVLLYPKHVVGSVLPDIALEVSVELPHTAGELAIVRLLLSTFPQERDQASISRFLDWVEVASNCLKPVYGWGGRRHGLFGGETEPVKLSELLRLEPQPIEWLNIFGVSYVERLDLRYHQTLPVFKMHSTSWGGLVLVLTPHPDQVARRLASQVAAMLGVPAVLG